MRNAARTDSTQAAIVAALRDAGHGVWYIRWPVDLLVETSAGWLPMEVKARGGRLTDDQQEFISRAGSCPVAVVQDVEGALRAARAMR